MIDLIIFLLIGAAFIKGYRDGLLKSVFNFLAWILGLAIAMKFTEYVSFYVKDHFDIQTKILPVLVFVGLFIVINIIVMRLSKALETVFEKLSISFLNNLGGGILSGGLLLILASVLLFYIDQMGLISAERKRDSWTYEKIAPMAPVVIGFVTSHIDDGKNAFEKIKEKYQDIKVPAQDSTRTI